MNQLKKVVAVICAAASITAASGSVMAANWSRDNGKIDVNINGKYLDFDVNPIMHNDRVMLPMRKIFESIGASVDWDENTKTITALKDGKTIKLTISRGEMFVNGESVALDAPAMMVGDRTLVPVRAVSEALDASVAWFGHGQDIVTISTYDFTCADAIQAVRNLYKSYTWHDFTDAEIDALNLEIYDIRYVDYLKKTVYNVVHNWGLRDEEGNELGGAHYINVKTGESVGGAG
ncbi:MAG: copper amine oxidase N-terminal domain-containing protein [Oscillospiraceae bacterium]|nr:copper amine oxidase N-terminal domain-containing protein [Oscillospiraceae bacterium]